MTRPVLNQAIAFALPSSVRPLGLFTEPTPALQASFPANRISSTVFVAIHSVLCLPSGPFANENEPSPACRFPDAHGDVGGGGVFLPDEIPINYPTPSPRIPSPWYP
jgi:hypothetical protein